MNNFEQFTKEELQIMLLDMECDINRNTIFSEYPGYKGLRNKIQSMVDNYCEHEPNYDTLTLRDESLGSLNYYGRCKKCGKFLDDNP